MPGSASSTSSYDRQSTGNSFHRPGASSMHSHQSRRSPSPTDHYREQHANTDRLHDRLFELNKFIYQGIDKFLDKQTVRDLIQSYDDEDLYPEGGLDGPEFRHTLSSDSEDEVEELLTVVQQNDKPTLIQQEFM